MKPAGMMPLLILLYIQETVLYSWKERDRDLNPDPNLGEEEKKVDLNHYKLTCPHGLYAISTYLSGTC